MKFGKLKTIIENNLSDSIKERKVFKENIKNFKKHILGDKNLSKLYVIYGDLSKPRGLNEADAKNYLDEGIDWAKKLIKKSKTPLILNGSNHNNYEDIDKLVYETINNIDEQIKVKNRILETIKKPLVTNENIINIPIKSMVKIANNKISDYINTLNEETKKEILILLKGDKNKLNLDFNQLKEDVSKKLNDLLIAEKNSDVSSKLLKALEKVNSDKFDILNYYELKTLNKSLNS